MKHIIALLVTVVFVTAFSNPIATGANSKRIITGVIADEDGKPLIGASVFLVGPNGTYAWEPLEIDGVLNARGSAITDFNGTYSVHVPKAGGTLHVSYIGYITKEEAIGVSDVLNITLELKESAKVDFINDGIMVENEIEVLAIPSKSKLNLHSYQMRTANTTLPRSGCREPVSWNTEDYALIDENKFHDPKTNPLSTFSIDTDGASYSNLRRFLVANQAPPIDAIRVEELVNYFIYKYELPEHGVPFSINTEVSMCPWNQTHNLVHIGLKGREIAIENLPASNLVFLLDVSGSMNAPNKLPLVVQSFKILTNQLREQDRVAIVVYAGNSGVVLPSTSGADKNKINDALTRLSAGGGTAGARGIQLAYEVARKNFIEGGNNRVILATDGDFNIGQSSDAELVRIIEKERECGVFLSVLGFGIGNYKDNKMQELADHGNGNHNYIDNISEAEKVFMHEFGGTLFTIAKDVKIQIEFNPAEVAAYRLIGYENRLLEASDFNNDKKDAGEIGSGHTVTALYEIIPTGVESDFLPSVDPLKYQKPGKINSGFVVSGELMNIKIRYKEPRGTRSMLVSQSVAVQAGHYAAASDNFRWSAAVAAFGMILRDSDFKGDATLQLVESLAVSASGSDPFGYRSEFIQMVRGVEPIFLSEVSR